MAFNPTKNIQESKTINFVVPNTSKKETEESIEYLFTQSFINNNDYTAFKESETEASLYKWVDNHWSRIEMFDAQKIALEWIKNNSYYKYYTERKAKDCVKTLTVSMPSTVKELDKKTILIPLSNYWLKIDDNNDITYFKPDRSLKITYCLNLIANEKKFDGNKYIPNKELNKDSKWKKFLDSSIPNKDVQKTLQEYIGYTLIPNADLQVALFCEGEGSNGKGVFFEVISALHQKEKVKSINIERLDGFGLTPLIDASLIIVPECGRTINEEMFKSIIAGDPVPVNRKNRDEITIKPTAKWLVSCNNLPTIKDQTDGTSRRMICVEWSKQFKKEEKIIGLARQIIEEELEDVLDWALNGLLEILKRDKREIFIAKDIEDKKNKHLYDTDSIAQWIEYCGLDYSKNNIYIDKSVIYDEYVKYCEENHITKRGDVNFWKEINRIFKEIDTIQPKINKNGKRVAVRKVNLGFGIFKEDLIKAVPAPEIKLEDDDCPF